MKVVIATSGPITPKLEARAQMYRNGGFEVEIRIVNNKIHGREPTGMIIDELQPSLTDYYEVRAFYAHNVEPPKVPGAMAFHTWNRGKSSRDSEIAAASSRKDICRVEWREHNAGNWTIRHPR